MERSYWKANWRGEWCISADAPNGIQCILKTLNYHMNKLVIGSWSHCKKVIIKAKHLNSEVLFLSNLAPTFHTNIIVKNYFTDIKMAFPNRNLTPMFLVVTWESCRQKSTSYRSSLLVFNPFQNYMLTDSNQCRNAYMRLECISHNESTSSLPFPTTSILSIKTSSGRSATTVETILGLDSKCFCS